MIKSFGNLPQRVSEISEEERRAAINTIKVFDQFLKQLWSARQHDKRLINVLEKSENLEPSALFEIRHLLRKFQREVKDRYTDLIIMFAGKRDDSLNPISKGILHILVPLEKDTTIRQIKSSLQDAMQQLAEFMEEFLESFEDFNSKDQIKEIVSSSGRADQIIQSIENIIDKQLRNHLEKNILGPKKISTLRNSIRRRIRLISMLEI
jgi:hypothetical protein